MKEKKEARTFYFFDKMPAGTRGHRPGVEGVMATDSCILGKNPIGKHIWDMKQCTPSFYLSDLN